MEKEVRRRVKTEAEIRKLLDILLRINEKFAKQTPVEDKGRGFEYEYVSPLDGSIFEDLYTVHSISCNVASAIITLEWILEKGFVASEKDGYSIESFIEYVIEEIYPPPPNITP